ncbi:hypothetical protein B0J11DRAFT_577109 [Dendryphion nanum]|uniref:Uncharacterized protein n=1 Tax=Dendryphion nanum TaxID=256645 RepID=A0A9P9E764_9PLEO|nr:hypothetical protein B0J11DRAFT_577109 [Dendryphion nanum]
MLPQHVLLALIGAVAAVPLNINLGAYSPALVVGDGEISLGSTESASELMATLASGATASQGQRQGQQQQGQAEGQRAAEGQGEQQGQQAEETAAKRAPNLLRALQNLGKRAPTPDDHVAAIESAMQWIKRDINSFNAALSYAERAMQNQPKVELGTEHAGIGILVNAGLNVPANSAANGAEAKKEKRSDVVAEESEAPKMTLVAITEV